MTQYSLKVTEDVYRSVISMKAQLERESGSELSVSEALAWILAWLEINPKAWTGEIGKVISKAEASGIKMFDLYSEGSQGEGAKQDPGRWKQLVPMFRDELKKQLKYQRADAYLASLYKISGEKE